jgi:uroporphyrinogen decarboxylase
MNSRERILTALDHREPDRIPFDLGACQVTGIHVVAHKNLRKALGLPEVEVALCDAVQQLAAIDDDVVTRMNIDIRGLYPLNSHNWQVVAKNAGDYWAYLDEWGITHHRPKENGLYYSVVQAPLPQTELTVEDISNHHWPNWAIWWTS